MAGLLVTVFFQGILGIGHCFGKSNREFENWETGWRFRRGGGGWSRALKRRVASAGWTMTGADSTQEKKSELTGPWPSGMAWAEGVSR